MGSQRRDARYMLSVLPGGQRQEVLAGPLMAVLVGAPFGLILAMWAFGGLLVARRQVARRRWPCSRWVRPWWDCPGRVGRPEVRRRPH